MQEFEEGESNGVVTCVETTKSTAGWIFAFIGVVVHELSHYLGVLIAGGRVTSYRLLLPPNKHGRLGYVSHTNPGPIGSWFISLAPFVFSGIVGFALFIEGITAFKANHLLYALVVLWLATSITWRAKPSALDLRNAKRALSHWSSYPILQRLLLLPLLPFMYLTIIILEIRLHYFTEGIGGLLWIIATFVIARAYTL